MNDWLVVGMVLVLGMAVGAAFLNWWLARKADRGRLQPPITLESGRTQVESLRLVQTQEPVLPAPKARYTGAPRHNRIG